MSRDRQDSPPGTLSRSAADADPHDGAGCSPQRTARQVLRGLEALSGPLPRFNPTAAAETPEDQFLAWLREAIGAGVREPHAMTLSTVDDQGAPDARVLLLKDIDARGWHFATSALSAKGRQLDANHAAALTFYWPLRGRLVRVRGPAAPLPAVVGAADFRERSPGARALALLEQQSCPLDSMAELESALADAVPPDDAVAPSWTVYALAHATVEFWQGDPHRKHTRLVYRRGPRGWARSLLWP